GGHGLLEAERIADRDHPVADAHLVGVAELDVRHGAVRLDLDEREVGLRIDAEHLALELMLARRELHENLVGMLDDVRVGDDRALGADQKARAETSLFEALRLLRHEAPEELLERIFTTERARPLSLSAGTAGAALPPGPTGAAERAEASKAFVLHGLRG